MIITDFCLDIFMDSWGYSLCDWVKPSAGPSSGEVSRLQYIGSDSIVMLLLASGVAEVKRLLNGSYLRLIDSYFGFDFSLNICAQEIQFYSEPLYC
jgi:hypothetical protein